MTLPKNYGKLYPLVFVKTGKGYEGEEISYAKKVGRLFGFKFEEITGSNHLLKKMIKEMWDEDFIVNKPGEKITLEKIYRFLISRIQVTSVTG